MENLTTNLILDVLDPGIGSHHFPKTEDAPCRKAHQVGFNPEALMKIISPFYH